MWSAERQIDGLTARNAQLETNLACLEADGRGGRVQTCHRVHDLLQTDLLCTIRDGETTLGKKDAEICSLAKDREIERLKAQLLHSKEVDGAQDIADRSTEPPSPILHSRWGSADNVDGASIFWAGNNSVDSKTPCGRKAPIASTAISPLPLPGRSSTPRPPAARPTSWPPTSSPLAPFPTLTGPQRRH
ncbi:unnamed protein product [Ectocarpus sp. 6 AP-2014]